MQINLTLTAHKIAKSFFYKKRNAVLSVKVGNAVLRLRLTINTNEPVLQTNFILKCTESRKKSIFAIFCALFLGRKTKTEEHLARAISLRNWLLENLFSLSLSLSSPLYLALSHSQIANSNNNNNSRSAKILTGCIFRLIAVESSHWSQCDQIWRYLRVLGNKFSSKSSQKIWWFFGLF